MKGSRILGWICVCSAILALALFLAGCTAPAFAQDRSLERFNARVTEYNRKIADLNKRIDD